MDETALGQLISELATPIVAAQGLEIWGLEFVDGPRMTVRLFVEAPRKAKTEEGAPTPTVGIDECEKISRQLDLALEAEGCFEKPWVLEVSTPGFSRRFFAIEQMSPYIGDIVEARLEAPLEGYPAKSSVFRGRLATIDGANLTIEPCAISADGEIIPENLPPATFPFATARRIARVHIFTPPPKPGGRKSKKGIRDPRD